jgi:hypothetical protein
MDASPAAAQSSAVTAASLVDLARYPVTDPGGAGAAAVAIAAEALRDQGVAILPGFLTAHGVARLVTEGLALAPLAHHSAVEGTAYVGLPDPSFPPGHPRRRLVRSSLDAVAYDLFPPTSALRALYEWDPLMEFVAATLGQPALHRYADPFGALNLAVMGEGDELGWHFDQTDFVVSLALQGAERGGNFENAARIRQPDDERYAAVQAVLDGDTSAVRIEPMVPGTLMLFAGRWSMHRVSPIRGTRLRLVALLAYDTKPGTDSTDLLKRVRYGRLPGDAP